jgi:DNA polymerase-3 subunit delta
VALYKLGDPTPLSVAEVEAVAPLTAEADDADLAQAVVEDRANDIPRLLRRLIGQGATPVGTVLALQRVLRAMPGSGADSGTLMARGRGVPFRLRDVLARSGPHWPGHRIEQALAALLEADATLRSSNPTPDWPMVEHTLLHIAMRQR